MGEFKSTGKPWSATCKVMDIKKPQTYKPPNPSANYWEEQYLKVKAKSAERLAVIEALEWVVDSWGNARCRMCHGYKDMDHNDWCALAKAKEDV